MAAITPSGLRLKSQDAALLIIDFQERLAAVIPEVDRIACERNILILLETARRLGLPVVLSEQYPKGLGPTVPSIGAALGTVHPDVHRLEKTTFACTDAPGFDTILSTVGRSQWILVGMESHVCVYQTARGLAARGLTVHVPRDAVVSRTTSNQRVGLDLAASAGSIVTSTEVVVFDLLERAGTDDFRALSRLIR